MILYVHPDRAVSHKYYIYYNLIFLFANDDFTTVESLQQAIIGSISCVYFLAQV